MSSTSRKTLGGSLSGWWRDVSIARRLHFALGLMATLLLCELLTLRFAMYTLGAARAFVGGEGLWSKSQKNSAISLQRYGRTRDERDFAAFIADLEVPQGDHLARLELSKRGPDLAVVRKGFLQGRIPPADVEPMIDLLRRFAWTSYLSHAIRVWIQADELLAKYRDQGFAFHRAITQGDEAQVSAASAEIGRLNDQLTTLEDEFSFVLGEGSRWLERIVLTLLSIAVLIVESVGISLTWLTTRTISRGLNRVTDAALRIGRGDFSAEPTPAPLESKNEIGLLWRAVDQMREMLERSYNGLEARVQERTEELARSRHQLDVIFRGITDGITVVDGSGHFVFANEAGARMCGASSVEDLLSRSQAQWIAPLDLRDEDGRPFPISRLPSSQAFAGVPDPPEVILRYRTSGGEDRWGLVKSAPILDEERTTQLVVTIFKDFTEHRRAEQTTRFLDEASQILASSMEHRDTLQKVVELTATKFVDACALELLDADGESHAVSRLRGEDGELRPAPWAVGLGASHVILTGTSETFRPKSPKLESEHFPTPPPELRLNSVAVVPVVARGKTFGVLAVATRPSNRELGAVDLRATEELGRRIGAAMESATLFQLAQRAALVREQFLSIASHELKTPLTSLSLQIQLARQRLDRAEQAGANLSSITASLDVADRQIDRLARLASELLDVSRIQSDRLVISLQRANLSDIVRDAAGRFVDQLARVGATLTVEITSEVYGVFDPIRLEQVVDNLLTNSLRYAPGKPVRLHLSATEQTAVLIVEDEGPGIAREHQPPIFERFERATTEHARSGLGLGLYIVREIVRGHGGSVRVESRPGTGACFTVEIPLSGPQQGQTGARAKSVCVAAPNDR